MRQVSAQKPRWFGQAIGKYPRRLTFCEFQDHSLVEGLLTGYIIISQGAQVVHLAAGLLSTSLYPRIAAIVTFGDPRQYEPFPPSLDSKALIICNKGDFICLNRPQLTPEHSAVTYAKERVAEAVLWVDKRLSGKSDPGNGTAISTSAAPRPTTINSTQTPLEKPTSSPSLDATGSIASCIPSQR